MRSRRPTPCSPAIVCRLSINSPSAHRHAVDADGGAALEFDLDMRGLDRRLVEAARDLEQRLVRLRRAIVAAAADRAAPQVVVDAIRRRASPRSCARNPASSAHAISFSAGLSVAIGCASRRRSRPIAPCATCVAFSIAAISDERLRDQRPRQRGRHRIPRIRQGAGLERRQHDVARELLARVDHVRARRARRQRMRSRISFDVARLPEIERDGDDFSAMLIGEPRNGGGRSRAAGICEHDDRFQLARSLSCLTTACALFGVAGDDQDGVVAGERAGHFGQSRRDRSPAPAAAPAPRPVLSTTSCWTGSMLTRYSESARPSASSALGLRASTPRRTADTRRPTTASAAPAP